MENPTEEEIAERERIKRITQESNDLRKQERIELERVTNKYKASSYLDKLKERNNVT